MTTKLSILLCAFVLNIFFARAQCGTDPVSGTNTISTSQVVNSYYPGLGNPTAGLSSLTVGAIDSRGSATVIGTGDLVLIIQMQGADIDATNTDTYGDGISGGPGSGYMTTNVFAGYYEFNTVLSVSGSTISFSYSLANNYFTRTFSSGAIQSYQVVRVPRDYNLTISAGGVITCPPWNGSTGGVVADDAANTLTLNGSITASGLGFRAGGGQQLTGATAGNSNGSGTLLNTDYRFNSPFTNASNLTGGAKGEGIAGTPVYVLPQNATTVITNTSEGYLNGSMGRGAPGNAGGGGTDGGPTVAASGNNQYNTGGGGGGNAGSGGQGGSGWHGSIGAQNLTVFPYGGYGGASFAQGSLRNVVMGGGGGAGTANNSTAANQYQSSGGCGGGIVILRAKLFAGSGTITADGGNAPGVVGVGGTSNTDAAGGAGAGGSIVAITRATGATGLGSIMASAQGGTGGSMTNYYDHGPGGGGGGGLIITNGAFSAANVTGGQNGLTRTGSSSGAINNSYGATAGANGQLISLAGAPAFANSNNPSSPCGVLPISLKSFSASINGVSVQLNWEIENAVNFSYFGVEYSTDGSSFKNIGEVPFITGQEGYHFEHSPVTAPVNYYRLTLVDMDGGFTYSNILVVRQDIAVKGMIIYPQPADDHIIVSIHSQSAQLINIILSNSVGNKVKETQSQLTAGNNTFTIYGLRSLPAGIYILSTSVDQDRVVNKVIINR